VGLEKIEQENEEAIKAVGAFGGGIASSGAVCGTLLGAVAAISSLHGRGNLEDRENPRVWGVGTKMIARFDELTKPYGGSNCSDIARLNRKDHHAVKEYYTNPESSRKECIKLVGDSAYELGIILEKELSRMKKEE
jgi:C_GCAxxG_C_C family probable redox protein